MGQSLIEGRDMGFAYGIRNILKPAFVGLAFLAFFSSSFVIAYVFFDYQSYLKDHQASQAREVERISKKAEAVFGDLKKLFSLTEARILASYENFQRNPRVDLQRVQRVLGSFYLQAQFYQMLLELQTVSYTKLSPPRLMVNRQGVLLLDSAYKRTLREPSGKPLFVVEDKTIEGTLTIMNPQGFLEGVLEIQFGFDAFKRILGTYETIDLQGLSPGIINETSKIPLLISRKFPDLLLAYAHAHKLRYAVFVLSTLFMALLIGLYLRFFDLRLQKKYRHKFEEFEDGRVKANALEKVLREELGILRQDAQIHKISYQAQKKFQANLKRRQQEQANHMALSLNAVHESFQNSLIQLGNAEKMEIIYLCFQGADALSGGLWHPMKKEKINFKQILDNIHLVFAEKIHNSAITVETSIAPEMTSLWGDHLLIEALLINAIGKPFHRAPKNGSVFISLQEVPGFLQFEVRDNGYRGSANQVRNSLDLFITEEAFQQLCLTIGLKCQCMQVGRSNITRILMPIPKEEIMNGNVVKLFP